MALLHQGRLCWGWVEAAVVVDELPAAAAVMDFTARPYCLLEPSPLAVLLLLLFLHLLLPFFLIPPPLP